MKYYTDGFVDGCNPSDKGGGYTILDEEKNLIKQEYVEKRNFTNNEGEILGIYNQYRFNVLLNVGRKRKVKSSA